MRGNARSKYLQQRETKRWQLGSFLNRYNFAPTGRDTVNQAMKGLDLLAPKLIDKASKEVDKIAEARIRQAISKSGQKKKKKKKKYRKYRKLHQPSYREL